MYSGAFLRIRQEEKYISWHYRIYEALYYLIDWCKKRYLITYVGGAVGNSFIAYLNGLTKVNPLIPHYVCTGCGYCEMMPSLGVKDGFDLPQIVCPNCGRNLNGDGHDLPFEILEDGIPSININVSRIRFEEIKEFFDDMAYYIETKDENTFRVYPREELIDDFITITGNDWCDIYSQMIEKTKYMPNDFFGSDPYEIFKEYYEVLNKKINKNILDETDYSDKLIEVQKLYDSIKADKFSDYTRIMGLLHGTCLYDKYGKYHLNSVFYNRDDKYMAMEKLRKEEKRAAKQNPTAKDIDLSSMVFTSDQIKQMSKRLIYMFPKAHLVSETITGIKLAWYKENFPNEYEEVWNGINQAL